MSLARHFFRELRPLFRVLEEPLGRPAPFGQVNRSLLDEPFFHTPAMLQPVIDVSEEGNHYVIEAELPGVKKENIQVRVGDGGRSLTIEGKVVNRRGDAHSPAASNTKPEPEPNDGSKVVVQQPEQTQLSTERYFTGTSSFSRTVFLPRPIDTSGVSAKLADGVLTVKVPKAEDPASVQVPIE